MATARDFRYVITTELKLAPGALNRLVGEINKLDSDIRGMPSVPVRLRVDGRSVSQLQREVGRINATAKIRVELDRLSMLQLQRQIQSLVSQAQAIGITPTVAPSAGNSQSRPTNRVGSGRERQQRGRQSAELHPDVVNARVNAYNARAEYYNRQIELAEQRAELDRTRRRQIIDREEEASAKRRADRNRKALEEQKRYNEELSRMRSEELGSKASPHGTTNEANHLLRERVRQEDRLRRLQSNLSLGANYSGGSIRGSDGRLISARKEIEHVTNRINTLNRALSESNKSYQDWLRNSSTRASGINPVVDSVNQTIREYGDASKIINARRREQNEIVKSRRVPGRIEQMQEERRVGAVQRQRAAELENRLVSTTDPGEQRRIIADLDKEYSKLARTMGTSIPKSFRIAKEDINGNIRVVSLAQREYTKFGEVLQRGQKGLTDFGRTIKNVGMYSGIAMGMYAVVNALQAGIQSMIDFEAQFVRTQRIITSGNQDVLEGNPLADVPTTPEVKSDMMDLSSRFNLNLNDDISPLYGEIIRRRDLFEGRDEMNRFTETLIRAGYVTAGSNLNSQDLLRISKDAISVYQQMFDTWNNEGKDSMVQMERFVDFLALLEGRGADLDKTMDAMSTLATFAGSSGASLNTISGLVGAYSLIETDASGSEIANSAKMFFTNLTSRKSRYADLARQQLGVDLVDETGRQKTLEEMLVEIASNIENDAYEGSDALSTAALYLSSQGSGGGRLRPQMQKLLESLPTAIDLSNSSGYIGRASEAANEEIQTLARELEGLANEFRQLAINIGDLGLLGAIKSVVSVMNSVLSGVNSGLRWFNQLGETLENSNNIIGRVAGSWLELGTAVIGMTAAVRLGTRAYRRFVPDSLRGRVSERVRGIGSSQRGTQSRIGERSARGGYIVGSIVSEVLGAILTGSVLNRAGRGRASRRMGNRAGNALFNLFGRLGDSVSRLIGAFRTLAPILARLGLIGAVATGAFATYNFLRERSENIRSVRANRLVSAFDGGERQEAIENDLRSFTEYRRRIGGEGFSSLSASEAEEYNELRKRLADHGVAVRDRGFSDLSGDFSIGNILSVLTRRRELSYEYEGRDGLVKGVIDESSKEATEESLNRMGREVSGVNREVSILEDTMLSVMNIALDYEAIMNRIGDRIEDINAVQRNTSFMSMGNRIDFAGATDSAGYLFREIGIQRQAYNEQSILQREIEEEISRIESASAQADENIRVLMRDIASLGGNPQEIMRTFEEQYVSQGNPDGILEMYSSQDSELARQNSAFAQSLIDRHNLNESLKETRGEADKSAQALLQMALSLKEMSSQYLVASTGLAVFNAELEMVQASISNIQTSFALAMNGDERIDATANVIGAMTRQYEIQTTRAATISAMMQHIRSSRPNEDFSISALYNPEDSLSEEQSAYRNLLEEMSKATSESDQTLQSIREQNDQLADLVLSSQRYSMYWESIQERISSVTRFSKQLRDLSLTDNVTNIMTGVQRTILGNAFDGAGYGRDQQTQARDEYLRVYEQIQRLVLTYGEDTEKLKEALSEIGTTTKDKIDTNLINPFNEAIGNFSTTVSDFGEIVNIAMDFVNTEILNRTKGIGRVDMIEAPVSAVALRNVNSLREENSFVSEGHLRANLGGRLTNYAQTFISEGRRYGVDPALMAAIAMHETGNGTSNLLAQQNNVGGITVPGGRGFRAYNTIEDGISDLARLLSGDLYIGGGLDSIAEIQKRYAPVGAGNDPNNLNQNWVSGVSKFYEQIVGKNYGSTTYTTPIRVTEDNVGEYEERYRRDTDINIEGSGAQIEVGNKAQEEAVRNMEAFNEILKQATDSFRGAIEAQAEALSLGADAIRGGMAQSVSDAIIRSQVSGMRLDAITGEFDALADARVQVKQLIDESNSVIDAWTQDIATREAEATRALNSGNNLEYELRRAEVNALKENIESVRENTRRLEEIDRAYTREAYRDPTRNALVGEELISERLGILDGMRSWNQGSMVGGVEWYTEIENINSMFDSFMNRARTVESSRRLFENTGYGYDRLAINRQVQFEEDVELLYNQMLDVGEVLSRLPEATNQWHVVLEDAVQLQERLIEIENQKAEMARRYFEISSNGLGAYVNARTYQQNRDYRQNNANLTEAMRFGTDDYNEYLVNLQIISDMHSNIQTQLQEYRDGVIGAFRAGALSVEEYLQKLNELRDVQAETRDQAISMTDSIQNTFESSLANALRAGFEGSFDAPLDFMQNVRRGIAEAITGQLSTVLMTRTGLMDSVNGLISSLVSSFTSGDPDDIANAFRNNSFQEEIDGALAPFLPLIEQISQSTEGMFGIMKDEVYNAPSGFKIDDYLYEFSRQMSYEDVMGWLPSHGDRNESGAPSTGGRRDRGPIVLPETSTPIGTARDRLNREYLPADPVATNPFKPRTINPVQMVLESIGEMQRLYDTTKSIDDPTNARLHSNANRARNMLSELEAMGVAGAQKILEEIGGGTTPDSQAIEDYLRTADLSQYEMKVGIDGVASGITTLNRDTVNRLSGVIDAVNEVARGVYQIDLGSSKKDSQVIRPNPPAYGGNTGGGSSSSGGSSNNKSNPTAGMIRMTHQDTGQSLYFKPSEVDWARGMGYLHTGGIAGVMNFADANRLAPDEVSAVLRMGEPVFAGFGQIGSLIEGMFGGVRSSSGGGENTINIDINIEGNGQVDEDRLNDTVEEVVSRAVREMGRQVRFNNLQIKGVGY